MAVKRKAFSSKPEVEYERSTIKIPIYLPPGVEAPKKRLKIEKGWPGKPAEILVNDAYMMLELGTPVRNYVGYNQFEFQIREWELIGYSEILQQNVTFTLSKTVQPRSLCRANNKAADFPAEIYYSAIYDVYVGKSQIVANQPGIAYAKNVRSIPPRDVTVAFEKPFESAAFIFGPGCCLGMRTITRKQFETGKAQGFKIRGW